MEKSKIYRSVRVIFEREVPIESDVDITTYYDAESDDERAKFRFKVLSELFDDSYDVQIFQQLPLYGRVNVLKGKLIYCKDRRFLYEIAMQTIKEFDDFRHRFQDYIHRGSLDESSFVIKISRIRQMRKRYIKPNNIPGGLVWKWNV